MSHDYLLKARGGQTMTVHLAARGGVGFEILAPNGDLISEFTKDWSGDLPRSGDYRINVLPMVIYTEFTLEANIAVAAALSFVLGAVTWVVLATARTAAGSTVAAAG